MKVNVKLEAIPHQGDGSKIAACRIHFPYSPETSHAVRHTNPSHWKMVERDEGGFSLQDGEGHHFVNIGADDVQESVKSMGEWFALAMERKTWSLALTLNLPDGGVGASFFKVDTETGKVLEASGPQRIGDAGPPTELLKELLEGLKSGDVEMRVLRVPKGMSPEEAVKAALDGEEHECSNCGACGKGKEKGADNDAEKVDRDHDPSFN